MQGDNYEMAPAASGGGHLMDIEKLIHCLQCCARVDAHNVGCDDCGLEYCGPECQQLCGTAATALSTLQGENEKLRAELEQAKRLYESEKEDFIDFACSGVPNLTPYCLNRHPDCVDERGWCRTEKCRGFSRERGQKED